MLRRSIVASLIGVALLVALVAAFTSCGSEQQARRSGASGGGSVAKLMKARDLSEADVRAALQTYTPTGRHDPYLMFASGGHSGQVIVIGVPSMRIIKYIGVFTPEPWQGYGYDDPTRRILHEGNREGENALWGDTHHPALSETEGDYDGKFLFIGDKANARIAVISLEDFTTQQIIASPLIRSDHGAAFVTPNTEYVIEATQYPAPLGGDYADTTQFNERYRGAGIFWKFDREHGRIDREHSFAIEFPPYMQDLADAGKKVSAGWAFFNSFNSERSFGGEGNPPIESGASQNDMDYLHVVNWRRAEELITQGKFEMIAGMKVIRMAVAAEEGVLALVPEPKSPHGCDVSPDGADIIVGGKLDTHATVYSFSKIQNLMREKRYESRDPYGIPILSFQGSIRGQVELGLGPLHTVFDDQGNAYTSLFLETKVARWNLHDLRLMDKVGTHYNIGHLTTPEGDTVSPDGHYLVAMNKWALDRFNPVGPLLPQNFQLVDISNQEQMTVLYDLPIPLGEPHYAQIISADKIHSLEAYRPVGIDATTGEQSPNRVEEGQQRVERKPDGVHIYMTAIRSHFTPDIVRVRQGEVLHFHITNLEQAHDATHGFAVAAYDVNLSLEPGEHSDVSFTASKAGVFPLYCTEFCSALHLEMAGYLLVEPAGGAPAAASAPAAPAAPATP
jgi:nitrous-oxide reductase